jgi:hypothetical protein
VVQLEGASLEVLEMDKHRITKVQFEFQTIDEEPESSTKEEKANCQVVKWPSKKILKDKEKLSETRSTEGTLGEEQNAEKKDAKQS